MYGSSSLLNNELCNSITPRNILLLGKLTGSQLVKKFPAFYRSRRLITVIT